MSPDRIEKELEKNEIAHRKFRDEYVKAPNFIITLIAVVTFISSTFGAALGMLHNRTESNTALIIKGAFERGRILERQGHIEKIGDMEIASALEKIREDVNKIKR